MSVRPVWLAVSAFVLAFLPLAQAGGIPDGILDPAPHDCTGPVDYECGWWSCTSPPTGCSQGCPGSLDCVPVTCGLYVETPTLTVCFHNGFVPFVRCMAGQPHATCIDYLLRE